MTKTRYSVVYAVWIVVCTVLYFAFSGAEDPSRREGRILNSRAGEIARQAVRIRGSEYGGYEVVHIAWASGGEAGREPRWVVLVDSVPPSALRRAVVVELRGSDGALLRMRPAETWRGVRGGLSPES